MIYWMLRPVFWVLLNIIYLYCGGIRFEGRKYVPKRGRVLFTPNHISDADPPTVAWAIYRPCYFMAKEELFTIRFIGSLIRWMRGFPVKRYSADRAALRRAEELLEREEAVVIFPEGKLSEDGTLQPFLPGALLVAHRADAPIVPTAIIGTDNLMPYGRLIPRRTGQRVVVRFGPPVTMAELTSGKKGGEALKQAAERLRALLQALLENRPYPIYTEKTDELTTEPTRDEKTDISAPAAR